MILRCRQKVRWASSLLLWGVALAVTLTFIGYYTMTTQKEPVAYGVSLREGLVSISREILTEGPQLLSGVILREGPKSLPGISLEEGSKSIPVINEDPHGVTLKNEPKSVPGKDKAQHGTLLREILQSSQQLHKNSYPQSNLSTKGSQNHVTETEETFCKHPTMELWSSNIKALMDKESFNLECYKEEKNWVYIANISIYIDIDAEKRHGNIACDCTSVERETDLKVNSGAIIKYIKNGTRLPSDFVYVNCTASDGTLYNNTHSGVLPHDSDTMPDLPEGALGLNILMIGFDSMSRLAWQRSLPETFAYLTESLGAVVLNGYNAVGDGTIQNLLPLLTGWKESELPEARRGLAGAAPLDGYPWIWDDFKTLGYATQWSEDVPEYGAFIYKFLGFDKQPVDHYMRNFYLYRQNKTRPDKPHCFGSVPAHLNMFNWARDMFESYKVRLKFSFIFYKILSHNYINHVTVADEDLTDTLKYMNNRGYFDNTLLMLMSDHGARFSTIRQILQGRFEERNPFFSVRLPPKFIIKYPEIYKNLQTNAKRLTTPFDVHATFKDVISYKGVAKVASNASRGISLFQKIPADRMCQEASLTQHWCLCLEWTNEDVQDPYVIASAKAFVEYVNELTKAKRQLCEELSLHTINRAEKSLPLNGLSKKALGIKTRSTGDESGALLEDEMTVTEIFYQIQVTTKPSMALYESTVKHSIYEDTYTVNANEISRVNIYGDQPHCVESVLPMLRPYCFCKIQL